MKSYFAVFACFLIITFIPVIKVNAQGGDKIPTENTNGAYQFGANLYGGFVMTAYERVANLGAHTSGLEIVFTEKTCGKKAWQCIYGMPRVGVSLFYMNFGKPHITGSVIAILPHIQFPFYRSKKTEIGFRMATGLGYFTKTFDARKNFKNKAISSKFNASLQPNFLIVHKISGNLEANAGFGITHFSNGSYSLPNNGINVPNIFAGLMYSFNLKNQQGPLFLKPQPLHKKQYFYAYLAAGTKQVGKFGEKRFGAYALTSVYGWQLSHKSKVGGGLDFYYDPALPDFINSADTKNYPIDSFSRAGFRIEHEFVIGNLGVVTNAGIYVFDKYKKDGSYYQHIGLKYNFIKNAFAGVFLKTHFANADFIEWALGINF